MSQTIDQSRSYYFFLSVVIMLSSVSLFATDVYLPALPEMAVHFNCSQTDIQVSFTVFLLGLAGCQLLAGFLSDRFGRKTILVVGFTLFIVSSILCAVAETLTQFISFRIIQAMGGGVGSVVSRTLVVDRYDRKGSVKIFSTIFPIVGLSAAIGPFIGGYLTYFWGWQAIFYFIALFGVVILVSVMICLKSNRREQTTSAKKNKVIQKAQGYWDVVSNFEFLAYALIICTSFSVFRSYAVESPFVFSRQGYAAEEIGSFYILLSIAYIIGNLSAKKLINSKSLKQVLRIGILFSVGGGLCMVASTLFFGSSPYAIIFPMTIITTGNGFLFPVASAGAMTAVRTEVAGTASGLMGALQFMLAALCINWIGEVCHGEAVPMSIFVGFIILLGLGCYFLLSSSKTNTSMPLA